MQRSSAWVGLLWCAAAASCAPTAGQAPEASIRERFPAQARRVLGEEAAFGFEARPDGFRPVPRAPATADQLARGAVGSGGPALVLPVDASDAARFEFPDGFRFSVRERSARGRGRVAGAAVVYERWGATSFWSTVERGYEEWIQLSENHPRVLEWVVEGAGLAAHPEGAVVFDRGGARRMRVSAPAAWDERGREVPVSLAVRGQALVVTVKAEGPVLVDPSWVAVDATALTGGRAFHTATALSDGTVVVIGGTEGLGNSSASVLVFDGTGWTQHSDPLFARERHTATLVAGDAIVVSGGIQYVGGAPRQIGNAFVYKSGAALKLPQGISPRYSHSATKLQNSGGEHVLLYGGMEPTGTLHRNATVLTYDPLSGDLSAAESNSILSDRWLHTATSLPDGTVLVAGGVRCPTITGCAPSMQRADSEQLAVALGGRGPVVTGTVKTLSRVRFGHSATLIDPGVVGLPGAGKIVFAYGGFGDAARNSLGSAEYYLPGATPDASSWQPVGSFEGPALAMHTASLLPSRGLLLVGGIGSSLLLYSHPVLVQPGTGAGPTALTLGDVYYSPRTLHALVEPPGAVDRVLVVGGTYVCDDWSSEYVAQVTPLGRGEFSGWIDLRDSAPGQLGEPCGDNFGCASTHCIDFICCDADCRGLCQECSTGFCRRIGTPEAPIACTKGPSPGICQLQPVCDGSVDDCPSPPPREDGTPCGAGTCQGGSCGPPPLEVEPRLDAVDSATRGAVISITVSVRKTRGTAVDGLRVAVRADGLTLENEEGRFAGGRERDLEVVGLAAAGDSELEVGTIRALVTGPGARATLTAFAARGAASVTEVPVEKAIAIESVRLDLGGLGGCGCSSAPVPASGLGLALLAGLRRRRTRKA